MDRVYYKLNNSWTVLVCKHLFQWSPCSCLQTCIICQILQSTSHTKSRAFRQNLHGGLRKSQKWKRWWDQNFYENRNSEMSHGRIAPVILKKDKLLVNILFKQGNKQLLAWTYSSTNCYFLFILWRGQRNFLKNELQKAWRSCPLGNRRWMHLRGRSSRTEDC